MSSYDFLIEKAASSDRATCERIMQEIYEENPRHWPHGLNSTQLEGDLYMVRQASTKAPAGFVGWQEEEQGLRKIGYYSIGILPQYRKQGLAKSAVQQILRQKAAGVDEVRAMIHVSNGPSMELAKAVDVPVEKVAMEKEAYGGSDDESGWLWERTPMHYGYGLKDEKALTPDVQLSILARAAEIAKSRGQHLLIDDISMDQPTSYEDWQNSMAEAVASNPEWASEWPDNQIADGGKAYVPQRYQTGVAKNEDGSFDWDVDPMMEAYSEWYEKQTGKPYGTKVAMEKEAGGKKGLLKMLLNPKAWGGGLAGAGLTDAIMYKDKSFVPGIGSWDNMDKHRGAEALFNALGYAAVPALMKSPLGAGGGFVAGTGVPFAKMLGAGMLDESRKQTTSTSDAIKNFGMLAGGLGLGGLGIMGYNAFKKKPAPVVVNNGGGGGAGGEDGEEERPGGLVRVTLPTKGPQDQETQIEFPFNADTIGLSNSLQGAIGRDVRRRLRDEAKSRVRRRGSPIVNTALNSLN